MVGCLPALMLAILRAGTISVLRSGLKNLKVFWYEGKGWREGSSWEEGWWQEPLND
jgi:hypothetical protein